MGAMIVITTPTGTIGAAVAESLHAAGAPLRLIARDPSRLPETLRQQAETYMDAHLGLETMSQLTPDHREAVLAIRDKRKPEFKGK